MSKAYEVPRVRLFNNLRVLDRSPLQRRPLARDQREGMSPSHLARIRLLPCCITGEVDGVEAHHLKSGEARRERGFGLKSADWWAVPIYWKFHWRLERLASTYEHGWFAMYAIRAHVLAKDLWAVSVDGDPHSVSNMYDVWRRHYDGAQEMLKRAREAGGMLPWGGEH